MSLIEKLKNANWKKNKTKPKSEGLEYLTTSKLKEIVAKGLSELYKIRPSNPVTFLSNWLMNEAQSEEILSQIEIDKKVKADLEQKQIEFQEEQAKIQEEKQKEKEILLKEKEDLETTITTCTDFEDNLNIICEKFKKVIGATGVYISKYDLKRKYPIEPDADETGHIDPANIKVLNYVNWCEDHSFLHRKYLEPETGTVTFSLINPKEGEDEEEKPPENENEEEGEAEPQPPKEEELKSVLVKDVVTNENIKFFREPRLGCYLAIDIRYMSSMQYSSLVSAIENLNEYKIKFAEQEKRREEKEAKEKEKEGEEAGEANEEENNEENENNDDNNAEGEEEEKVDDNTPVTLKEFDKEEKVYILSIDTLGQDRVFTEEEMKYILDTAKLLKNSMMNLEIKLLEKDRDLRIEYLGIEKPLKEDFDIDRIQNDQDNAVKDYAASDEFLNKNISDDLEKEIDFDVVRAKAIINMIYGTEMINLLNMFEKFEFVEYEKIFQNLFYFAKVDGLQINEDDTHKLSWKKSRKIWVSILETIKNYDPIGPKPGVLIREFKGNVILENLQSYNEKEEELSEYSFALAKLVSYVVEILKVRKADIIRRYRAKKQKEKERNDIIKKNEEIEEGRKNALEEAKEEFNKEHEEEENEDEEEEEDEEKKEGEDGENKEEGEEGEQKAEGEEAEQKENEEAEQKEEGEEGEQKEGEEKEGEPEEEKEKKDDPEGEEVEQKEEDEKKENEEAEQKEEGEEEKKEEEGEHREGEEGEHEEGEEGEQKVEGEEAEQKEEGEEGEEKEGEEGGKKKKKKKEKKPKPIFNEEEFLQKYDEEHPKLDVPEEVVFDLDEDFDLNLDEEAEEDEKEDEKDEDQD